MKPVMIYIRTSTEEQNPENQLANCNSINTYGESEIFRDQQSAWKDNIQRDDFNRLKKEIKKGGRKHLITWDFDRLYRNRIKFKEFLSFLKAYDIQLHSFRQDWFEDLHKIPAPWNEIVMDLMINIYGHIAEDESKKKSDRVKLAVRKKDGKTFSYKGNKWGRKTLSTQKINRLKELSNSDMSMQQIADEIGMSKGAVHKYLTIIKERKQLNMGVQYPVNK